MVYSVGSPAAESLSRAYVLGQVAGLRRIIALNLPDDVRRALRSRIAGAYHSAADHERMAGARLAAWRWHVASLMQPSGWRYPPVHSPPAARRSAPALGEPRSPTRLLVIGIDAASPDLLDAWTADGTLPNLAALSNRGLVARTRGIEGFFVGSTWASLYTGTNPAQHGLHYQMQLVSGSYRLEDRAAGAFVERDPFWRVLSRAGKRVAVLDVPLSKIEVRSSTACRWWSGAGTMRSSGIRRCLPSSRHDIETRFGRHPAGASCDAAAPRRGGLSRFMSSLESGVQRKGAWSAELLARGGWDLFMQVFTESHCVGHQCWHLHDPAHPAHDATVAAITGDPLRAVYRAIDREIGALVEAAGDAHVIVFAAHGMARRYGAHFLLRDVLFALGVAAPTGTADSRARARSRSARVARTAGVAARAGQTAAPSRDARQRGPRSVTPGIGVDPDRSLCFPLANGLAVSGIRLNPRRARAARHAGARRRGGSLRRAARAGPARDRRRLERRAAREASAAHARSVRGRASGRAAGSAGRVERECRERKHDAGRRRGRACERAFAQNRHDRGSERLRAERRASARRAGSLPPARGWSTEGSSATPSLLDLAPTFARILGVELPGAEGAADSPRSWHSARHARRFALRWRADMSRTDTILET